MKNALTALHAAARQSGYDTSIYLVHAATNDTVLFVSINSIADAAVAKWLKNALPENAKFYELTKQCAAALSDARQMLYTAFSITPKELCDCVAAAELLRKIKQRKPDGAKQLFYLSNYSGYAVFAAFAKRVFGMTPSEILTSPKRAQQNLIKRFPAVAPVLIQHADTFFAINESPLFLVVIKEKTEPQNRTTKPTQNFLDKKRRGK